ncbi:MAG: hypothetical protein JJU34_06180 [Lunatimonas sp.]|uniref:hypothetical protein n=1 Tax=Lunatimonas sp. TaxID=2060141 RepID=UPI00263BD450|nr:hypothetical protein [Lunatimonas sp.]MCC5936850.1 hypothetical protein [Lunatimonas sp.]
MKTVITGEIIGLDVMQPGSWLDQLGAVLARWGIDPSRFQVFRGNGFQLLLQPDQTWDALIWLKAGIRAIPGLDLRMGVGVGKVSETEGINVSDEEAYVYSLEAFERLAQLRQYMVFKSRWPDLDGEVNLTFKMILTIMNTWTPVSCEAILEKLEYATLSQKELGVRLGISQHAISTRFSRAQFDLVQEWAAFYRAKLLGGI